MRRESARILALALLCAVLGACESTGRTRQLDSYAAAANDHHLSDSKPQKAQDAVQTRVALGKGYMEQGKYELAMESLQKALEHDANSVDAHTVIAVLYERIGNAKAAEQHYARAAELAPKSGDTNNNYGQFLCATGRYEEAQKYFARGMDDPFYKTPGIIYANAGICLADRGGEGQAAQAEQYLRKALELDPNNASALYYLAKVMYMKNDFFRARAFIQRFEALGKSDAAALLLARNIEVKLGHNDSARTYAEKLRKDFPDSEQTRALESVTPSAQ